MMTPTNQISHFGVKGALTALLTATMILACTASAQAQGAPENPGLLDKVYFGDPDSEQQHDFESTNAVVPDGKPGEQPEVYVKKVINASAGVGWIGYKFNQPTTLDKVKMTWGGHSNRTFFFKIKTSRNGKNWKDLYSGNAGGSRTTEHEFDPVKARYVKVIKGGMAGWWRPKTWELKKIQFNDLPATDAYRSSHAVYEPALGESCRRLLSDESEESAWLRFKMEVDPNEQNYFTVKFWGGDQRGINLRLHDGDGKAIDGAVSEWGAVHKPMGPFWEFRGLGHRENFVYATYPLPTAVTNEKSEVTLKISSSGGTSQGIYAAYTHKDKCFIPPEDEQQGEPFEWGAEYPQRLTDEEKENILKQRARKLIEEQLSGKPKPSGLGGARLLKALSDAYHAEWSEHYQDPEIVDVVKQALDAAVRRQTDKGVAGHTSSKNWHYQGLMARSLTNIGAAFKKSGVLDEKIDHDGDSETDPITRRKAYDWYFQKGYEWRRSQGGARREVSNQSMAISFSLYRMQKALQLLESDKALSEKKADRYLYEALGMKPFYAPYPRFAWVKPAADAGFPFRIITQAGLAREGGHASHYGELSGARVARMAYELGDPAAKQRASQIIRARMIAARRPGNDGGGYAVLKEVFPFTYRGRGYPGGIRYLSKDEELTTAAILEDPVSLRLAELYLKHGQFTKHTRQDRVVRRVEDYLKVKEMLEKRDPDPLPAEPGHGNFAWGDPGTGVFAFKHGDTRLYGSFVLSMPGAVVPIARILDIRPRIERLADVQTGIRFPQPDEYVDPGGILEDMKFPRTPPPPKLDSELVDKWRGDIRDSELVDKWRGHDIRASMAYLYTLRYGDYLIVMNTTQKGTYREQTFNLDISDDVQASEVLDVDTGKMIDVTKPLQVPPQFTGVLYLGE